MDFISSAKNAGASAFGTSSSSSSSGSSSGSGGFSNLSIQKMVLLLAIIAFVIAVGTVAILLWKSKSTQKWPPEIARCPDRMEFNRDTNECIDNYGLLKDSSAPPEKIIGLSETDHCDNFMKIKDKVYEATGLNGSDGGYVPWEGIVDGQKSRAASLKCLV
jgi:preprotein translocase subunit SecG